MDDFGIGWSSTLGPYRMLFVYCDQLSLKGLCINFKGQNYIYKY